MSVGPILVVDDEPTIRTLIADILELDGHTVVGAADGAVALELLDRCQPALILCDLDMPGMDGRAFARALRRRPCAVPLVIMTAAHGATHCVAEIGSAGALPKPFDPRDLLALAARVRASAPTGTDTRAGD